MARARMVAPTISTDAKVRRLPCTACRLLFTWIIAHADNCGRLRAEPAFVRALVLPHEPDVTDADVETWLETMSAVGLIWLYEHDGGRFLQLCGWKNHQRLDRMSKSNIPPPPSPVVTGLEPVVTDCKPLVAGSRSEVESEREGEVEVEGEREREGRNRPSGANKLVERRPHPPHCACEICFSKAVRPLQGVTRG